MSHDDLTPVDFKPLLSRLHTEDEFVVAVATGVRARRNARDRDPLVALGGLIRPFAMAAAAVATLVVWASSIDQRPQGPRTVAEAVGIPPEFLSDGALQRRTAP